MKEPVEMFILAPAYFNVPYMKYSMEGAFTVTLPIKEMKKFETQSDINNFLFLQYNNAFFENEIRKTELLFEFFFQRKNEYLIKNLKE